MAEIHLLKLGNGLRNFPRHHIPRKVQLRQFRHINPQFLQIELQLIPRRIKPPHIIRPVQQPHGTPCYIILRQIDIIVKQILLRLPIIQVEVVVRQVQCLGACHVHFWEWVLQGVVRKVELLCPSSRNCNWGDRLEMLLGILPENLLYDSLSLMSSGKESKKSGKLPESLFFSRLKDVSFLSCRILSGMVPVRRLPPKLSSVN
nr:hypothetical protein Iba_chr12cCG16660 [Ipomoea batatas]